MDSTVRRVIVGPRLAPFGCWDLTRKKELKEEKRDKALHRKQPPKINFLELFRKSKFGRQNPHFQYGFGLPKGYPALPKTKPATNPSSNNTVKSEVNANLQQTVQVRFPTFHTRRQELAKANKPIYDYKPTILKTWQISDYIKHNNIFKKNVTDEERKELSLDISTLKTVSLDISALKKDRSITFKPLIISQLKLSIKPQQRRDFWWIVADTKVLLDDMQFIDRLVKSDPTCRIYLPYEVLHDLTFMTHKRHPAWMRIPARRLVNYIETAIDKDRIMVGQGMVENEDLLDSPVATDAVLNCCLQQNRLYYYAVTISDNEERLKRAASAGIPAFSLAQVREMVTQSFIHDGVSKPNISVTVQRLYSVQVVPVQRVPGEEPELHLAYVWL